MAAKPLTAETSTCTISRETKRHASIEDTSSMYPRSSNKKCNEMNKLSHTSYHSIIFIMAACSATRTMAFSTSRSSFPDTTTFLNRNKHRRWNNSFSPLSFAITPESDVINQYTSSQTLQSSLLLSSASKTTTNLFSSSKAAEQMSEGKNMNSHKADEGEWNSLIASFKMYRAAYGDLKVPSRFVVPAMSPWPESGWGLKLGQRVAAIRSTGKYVEGDDERRKVLDDMGFLWRLRAPSPDKNMDVSFDQIYDALLTYRKEVQPEGSLIVPPNFIVPRYEPWPETTRGMPLGKKIPAVRTKAYLKANPTATEKLEKIGFEFDGKVAANDARFENVFTALVHYKKLNSDLLVPQPFVIPEKSADWPEDTWGLRLGARVNAIRSQGTFVKTNPDRKDRLNALGFEWELPAANGKKRGRKKKEEIEALNGPAPPGLLESEYIDQGDNEDNAESKLSSPSFRDDVFQIGDKPDAPVWGFEDEEAEQKAAMMQQNVEDEIVPPKNLNQTLTEAAARAMEVGVIESLGEGKRVTKGSIHKVIPWFNDDFGEDFVFEDVVEALTIYQTIHGSFENLHSDFEFVVPEPSFGSDIDIEASAEAAQAIARAENLGEDSDSLIAAEIERIELEMSGSTLAESDENESNINALWPEHLAGMKLGTIVSRICDGSLEVKHLSERKKALDAIGFDWGDERQFLDIPFEKAMCAMFAYFLVRGDLFVYEDFVMPGEKPWPKALAGYELGKVVVRIRQLQNFFEAYHPEKVRLLRRVEFVWFPELALPLNPEDGEESWEDTFVEGVGHPFYQMNEPQVASIERLQAEGPFGPEDKSKSWYDYNEVSEFWERGDITDVGKESERPNWRPAEWLWFNGFEQLAKEHEGRYGITPGLEVLRIIEQFHSGEISEKEFDERGEAALLQWEEEQLRNEAISAGIEVLKADTTESIIEKIKGDPQFLELENDPEYKSLIEAELDADEAREALLRKMDMEEMEIDEDDLFGDDDDDDVDFEFSDDEEEEENVVEEEDEAYLEDKVDDEDDEEDEELDLEEEEDDFGIEEEEI